MSGNAQFPNTRFSLLHKLQSGQPAFRQEAFDSLINIYWKPVYKYIRLQWRRWPEDAQDLTQAFFLEALEKSFFEKYAFDKARFRTFIKLCVDRYVQNADKAMKTAKRGGRNMLVSLDFATAENQITPEALTTSETPDRIFEKEWIRSLFEVSLQKFRNRCSTEGKEPYYKIFERYDLHSSSGDRPSYSDLASEFSVSVSQVTNYLAWARREFRETVLNVLRTSTSSEEEFRMEARVVLGVEL